MQCFNSVDNTPRLTQPPTALLRGRRGKRPAVKKIGKTCHERISKIESVVKTEADSTPITDQRLQIKHIDNCANNIHGVDSIWAPSGLHLVSAVVQES